MRLTSYIAAAALSLGAASASANEQCTTYARILAKGVADGQKTAPVMSGVEASVWMSSATTDIELRVAASAYLMGYSQGLIYSDPAQVIADFMNGCMSEGA